MAGLISPQNFDHLVRSSPKSSQSERALAVTSWSQTFATLITIVTAFVIMKNVLNAPTMEIAITVVYVKRTSVLDVRTVVTVTMVRYVVDSKCALTVHPMITATLAEHANEANVYSARPTPTVTDMMDDVITDDVLNVAIMDIAVNINNVTNKNIVIKHFCD
jgi:hypothetical protein